MEWKNPGIWVMVALAFLPGCAAQRYQPAPLNPVSSAATLESRTLNDPGLRAYLGKSLGRANSPWPAQNWDLTSLTLAALYFSPQMEVARGQFAVAEGGVVAAREHPNPTLSLTPGIPSPYLFDMPLAFPIETHGKRALRIEQAWDLSSAAKIGVAEAAWRVASDLRKTLLAYEVAKQQLALAQAAAGLDRRRVAMVDRLLASGEGARPALQAAELAASNTEFAIRKDEGQVATARAALAGAVGVPVAALDGARIVWPNFERLPALASLSPQRIRRDAVLNRLDVRRALAEYAAADAALRGELARQYPDLDLGPGYTYEESNNLFTVPLSIVLPIRNRNQGGIAEAEAMRKEAAAKFLDVQALAISESQQALAGYRAALASLDQANRPAGNQRGQVEMAERAVASGETDRLQLNALELGGIVYARQRLDALAQAQAALGALEDAVERPLGADIPAAIGPQSAGVRASAKEWKP